MREARPRLRETAARIVAARIAAAAVSLGLVAVMTLFAPAAQATPGLTVTGPGATTMIGAGEHFMVHGFSVSSGSDSDLVTVIVSVSRGTIAVQPGGVDPTSDLGLTLSSGYAWSGQNVVRFSGTVANVNTALKWVNLASPQVGATVALFAEPAGGSDQSVVYSPDSGHFYEYVASTDISWLDAKAAAEVKSFGGQKGYLTQIPSETINSFITSKIPGATNVWIGARASMYNEPDGLPNTGVDSSTPRNWQWVGGPLNGLSFFTCTTSTGSDTCQLATTNFCPDVPPYANWAYSEPNNFQSTGERYAVTNWDDDYGFWNDLRDKRRDIEGYVVEYGDNGGSGSACGASTFTGVPIATTTLTTDAPTTTSNPPTSTTTSSPAPSTSKSAATTSTPTASGSTLATSIPTNNMRDPVTFTSTSPPPPPALPGVSSVDDGSTSRLDLTERTIPHGATFNAIATGFKPGTVVDFYIWSKPVYLGSAIADIHGVAVLPVTLGAEYIGDHHVQSIGTGMLGEPRNLAQPITVVDSLANTGINTTAYLLAFLAFVTVGTALLYAGRRPRQH